MPYIPAADREEAPMRLASPGELNFAITCLINSYIRTHGLGYQHINDVVGALEGAKLEFYRRIVAPYEDGKIRANGDVYGPPEQTKGERRRGQRRKNSGVNGIYFGPSERRRMSLSHDDDLFPDRRRS